jgi:hypothetical protein
MGASLAGRQPRWVGFASFSICREASKLMAELAELSDTQRQPSRGRRLLQFSLRTLFVVMAFFALLCAVGVTLYNSLPNEVTRAEIDQLRPGMTKGEVQAILGRPDEISQTNTDGQSGERWTYGIWGWMIFFVDDSFVQAELF